MTNFQQNMTIMPVHKDETRRNRKMYTSEGH